MPDDIYRNKCFIWKKRKKQNNKDFTKYNYEWYTIEEWVKAYSDYKSGKTGRKVYHDPDAVNKEVENWEYYDQIRIFLQEQLKPCEIVSPNKEKLKPEDRTIVFLPNSESKEYYLCTDQFGFSEDGNTAGYPYYSWISKTHDFKSVAQWLYITRSLGGSFVWPKCQYSRNLSCHYNYNRGTQTYIQDRVDLTLMEIKNYLDCGKDRNKRHKEYSRRYRSNKGDKSKEYQALFCEIDNNDATRMRDWLDIFDSFSKYVEIFKFKDFCVYEGGNYIPIDIASGKKMYQDPIKPIEQMDKETLKLMLNNLCGYIVKRSDKIQDVINHQTDC